MENNKVTKPVDTTQQELESQELLQKAKQKKGRQLRIDIGKGDLTEVNELREMVGKEFENPDEKYNTYYNGMGKLLRKYLPKGKEFKEERQLIYDEKNVFLNRGKKKSDNNGIRKSDGRMTYQEKMNEMLDVVVRWASTSQHPHELYNMLYELNEKHGYGHEDYDVTSREFGKAKKAEKNNS